MATADPLGVLATTRRVVDRARLVAIDDAAIARLAGRLAAHDVVAPAWRVWPHWWDDSGRAAETLTRWVEISRSYKR